MTDSEPARTTARRIQCNDRTGGEHGKRALRPLAAIAVVALLGAGCANAAAQSGSGGANASNREQAVKFAECMRKNGVREFPDPDASGDLTIDRIANGSSLDTNGAAFQRAVGACRDLQPSGFTGTKRSPEQQQAALTFAQCMRDNGVKDFPDPTPDGPIIDTSRMPGDPAARSIPGFQAAQEKCGAMYAGEMGLKRQ
jgi:hypothetical protein